MANKGNRDEVPDTVNELLGISRRRRNIYRGLQSPEDLKTWRNLQIDSYLERLDKARMEERTEILYVELPKVDVEKIRLLISEIGEFESVEDFVRRIIWNKLDNLQYEDFRYK